MPFEMFDRSRLSLLPLHERVHDLDLQCMMDPEAKVIYSHPTINLLADAIRAARRRSACPYPLDGRKVGDALCLQRRRRHSRF
jgi:hypothetical protein